MSSIPNGPQDDWSNASQELFQAARSDHAPSAADRERVRRALAQRIATAPGMSGLSQVAGRGASALSRVLKLSVGVSLAVVAAIAVTLAVKRAPDASPPRAVPASAVAAVPTPPAKLVEQPQLDVATSGELVQAADDNALPSRAARRSRPRAATSAARPVNAPLTAAAPGETTLAPAAAQAPHELSAPTQNAARDSSLGATSTTRVEQPETVAHAAEAELRPAKAEPTLARAHTLESQVDTRAADARAELAMLRRIQAALRAGEPASVLALCTEHEQRWPYGTFVQEREGLRAIASCKLGEPAANTRSRVFLAKYPRTPLGPRVRDACRLSDVPTK